MDFHAWLTIGSGREYLTSLGRNSGIGFNEPGKYASQGFYTQRKRSNIEKQYVFHISGKYAPLNGCAYSYHFIRVYTLGRGFPEEFLYGLLNSRNSGRSSNQNNFVNILCGQSCILQRGSARIYGSLYQRICKLL